VLLTENQQPAQRVVISICGGAARWSDVTEYLLKEWVWNLGKQMQTPFPRTSF